MELWSQQNRTEPGISAHTGLCPEVENANQCEEASCGVGVNIGFTFLTLLQDPRPFIVNTTPCHIDGLNL